MQNYIEYEKRLRAFLTQRKLYPETTDDGKDDFYSNLVHAFKTSKVFHISDDIKKLLMLTTPPNKNASIRLPFPTIFIDVKISSEEAINLGYDTKGYNIIGLIVQEGTLIHNKTLKEVGKNLRIILCRESSDKQGMIYFETFNENNDITDEDFKEFGVNSKRSNFYDKEINKMLHYFSLNFLNLLNDPEIELVHITQDKERNDKRIKKGKIALPDVTSVRIDAKRKVYIDALINGNHFTYSYRFFVRGHWRELKSDRYKEKKRLWILPYVKGKGILIDKEYQVESK